MISMPLFLHPRSNGLTRLMEHICDCTMQLIPLPRLEGTVGDASEKDRGRDNKMQGILKVHTMPDRDGGGPDAVPWEDLSFSLSRTGGMKIQPLSLPPLDDGIDDSARGPSKSPEAF